MEEKENGERTNTWPDATVAAASGLALLCWLFEKCHKCRCPVEI